LTKTVTGCLGYRAYEKDEWTHYTNVVEYMLGTIRDVIIIEKLHNTHTHTHTNTHKMT